jgi:hypothetical protein
VTVKQKTDWVVRALRRLGEHRVPMGEMGAQHILKHKVDAWASRGRVVFG